MCKFNSIIKGTNEASLKKEDTYLFLIISLLNVMYEGFDSSNNRQKKENGR